MTNHILSPDTQASLLLCGSLGQTRASEPTPLTLGEYNHLAQWLHQRRMRPADLLRPSTLQQLSDTGDGGLSTTRLGALLDRGVALSLAVESWAAKGLWVLSRADSDYPPRLRERLGRAAPAILYGVGNQDLLTGGGLVILGSRDADEVALAATRRVAHTCAAQGIQVVSGGARGVDSEAMHAALQAGGHVVGVLADSLTKMALSGAYRDWLRQGRLVLISPYDPSAGFSVGAAMGRNKCIYTLGSRALVVAATLNQGGAWAGAVENLKHGWLPLHVLAQSPVPDGNRALIEHGGVALSETLLADDTAITAWLTETTPTPHIDLPTPANGADAIGSAPASYQLSLFRHD